ncbi:unnamed protein product [Eruca vesicaria subsp. sativa]|uniref:Transmembrane protein n=1 Tax=Eruca vesicaria subsp. sativa TaxID=29727 RepID=A0ABC8ITT8_ERUVS|nr:unnamed protein product [Eruca vesicaria subsp. sativa]
MQRLSIDSSASKLHSYNLDDLKRKESLSFSPPPPSSSSSSSSAADYDDHDLKDVKLRRLSSPYQKRENLVHFIPVLTLICFIILYLTSHAPSQSDLAQFNGFMRQSIKCPTSDNSSVLGQYICVWAILHS